MKNIKVLNSKELIEVIKNAYKVVRVWQDNVIDSKDPSIIGFVNGWNACIKEQKRNEKKYIKHLESERERLFRESGIDVNELDAGDN